MQILAKELGILNLTNEQLTKDKNFIFNINNLLLKQHEINKLNSLEKIKKFHINLDIFENMKLLTTTFKRKRKNIEIHFKDIFEELYKDLY